jgi:3-deoxy-D-manno-octulosonic-acid transferase
MMRPMFFLYEALLYLVFILASPVFLLIGVLRGKYLQNLAPRLGRYRHPAGQNDLWIHAVSVGEALAAKPVFTAIETLRPDISLVVTTTTITGQAMARKLFPHATVTYFPFDFSFAVNRFLDHHRPRVFATMETEIWPNLTRLASSRGVRLILANARISDRSFPRYRRVRALLRPVLQRYGRILAREETDRQRFIEIGASADRVDTSGNVKFDFETDEKPLEIASELARVIGDRRVLVIGSTMEGEDEILLPEMSRLIERHGCFVVVAPRKAERFEVVAGLMSTMPNPFVRRTEIEASRGKVDMLLLDSFGELAKIYRYAVAAFVGGSLVPTGGHNPIEPAAAGAPVAFGRSMSNFREIAQTFLDHRAARQVGSAVELTEFFEEMLTDERQRQQYAARAVETVRSNRGAAARTATRIVELLD